MKVWNAKYNFLIKFSISLFIIFYLIDYANLDDFFLNENIVHSDCPLEIFEKTGYSLSEYSNFQHSIPQVETPKHKVLNMIFDEDSPTIRNDKSFTLSHSYNHFILENEDLNYFLPNFFKILFIYHCSLLN